jgi:transposase
MEETMAKIGRPSKLSPEITERICAGIRSGLYLHSAAELAGVHVSTVNRWMAAGADEGAEGPHAAFRTAIKKAESETQAATLDIIRQAAANGTWTAAAWYLERRHPELWGRHGRDAREASQEAQEPAQNVEQVRSDVLARIGRLMASEEAPGAGGA